MKSAKFLETYKRKFIKLSQDRFPDKFEYDTLVYTTKETTVTLVCKEHGPFEIKPCNHYSSKTGGCPECNRLANIRCSRDEFVDFVYKFHGGKYTYEDTNYVNSTTPVKITCPIHGSFWQVASEHKRGGCNQCRPNNKKLPQEVFEARANEVHKGRYSYQNAIYEHGDKSMDITCPDHGDFKQAPHQHLAGQGCPKCKAKAYGWQGMYVYILNSDTHPYTKIGITKKTPESRCKSIRQKSGIVFKNYSNYYFADGGDALCIEMDMLKWLRDEYTPIEDDFDGSTEAFVTTEYEKILEKLHESVAMHFKEQSRINELALSLETV